MTGFGQGKRTRERAAIAAGELPRFGQKEVPRLVLRCNQCRELVGELMITEHLLKCQPAGAKCPNCSETYMPAAFLGHIKTCNGSRHVDGLGVDTLYVQPAALEDLMAKIKTPPSKEWEIFAAAQVLPLPSLPAHIGALLVKDNRVVGWIGPTPPAAAPDLSIDEVMAMRKPLNRVAIISAGVQAAVLNGAFNGVRR